VGLQEHHDLADDLLFGPCRSHQGPPLRADAFEFREPLRGLFYDVEHVNAKGFDQLFGKMRPDALDHAGAEIFLNPFQSRGLHDLELGSLELQPVGTVVDPVSKALNVLARCHRRGGADDRGQVALAAHLDAQHTEPACLAVKSHPFHRAAKAFEGMGVIVRDIHQRRLVRLLLWLQ